MGRISLFVVALAATGCADTSELLGPFELTRHTRSDDGCAPTEAPLGDDQRTIFPRSALFLLEAGGDATAEESDERRYRACASDEFCDDVADAAIAFVRDEDGGPWTLEVSATREGDDGCRLIVHRGEVEADGRSWRLEIERLEGTIPESYACAASPEITAMLAESLSCTGLEVVEARIR